MNFAFDWIGDEKHLTLFCASRECARARMISKAVATGTKAGGAGWRRRTNISLVLKIFTPHERAEAALASLVWAAIQRVTVSSVVGANKTRLVGGNNMANFVIFVFYDSVVNTETVGGRANVGNSVVQHFSFMNLLTDNSVERISSCHNHWNTS